MRIKWLHLSDIHFNYKSYNSDLLRKDFIKRIQSISKAEPFTHFFLTGDILHLNEEACEETIAFINELVNNMGLDYEHVIVVPGNHDHDRNYNGVFLKSLYDEQDQNKIIESIDNLLDDDIKNHLDSFSKFEDIYKKIFNAPYYENKDCPHIIKNFGELTVVKINTAWLEFSSEKDDNVYCGSRHLEKKLSQNERILENGINIAIGHHPIDNMAPEERKRTLDLFHRYNIGLYFCGHKHKPSIHIFSDEDVLQLTCPGGYNNGYSEGGYIWGIVDTERDFYKAEFYSWNNGDWSIESKLKGTDERGILYFDTKRFKHNSDVVAIDFKMLDGHIQNKQLEQSIGDDNFDVHFCDIRKVYDWENNEKAIENFGEEIKYFVSQNKQVNIYPLAPIPMLIKLGFELQNNSSIVIHQYDRETGKWVSGGNEDIDINCKKEINNGKDLVVKVSTSIVINDRLIKNTLSNVDYDCLEFQTTSIDIGRPLYYSTNVQIVKKVFEHLNNIVSMYDNIHLFVAAPAGFAIELGRQMLRSMYYNVHTYQLDQSKYQLAYIINPKKENTENDIYDTVTDNVDYVDEYNQNIVMLPILGKIACGSIEEAIIESEDYFPISASILGKGSFFVLRAKGDSMIEAGIEDGDLILIRQQNTAHNGQIVVARVENETTLKRFYRDDKNKQVILRPENIEYKDQLFKNVDIQGVAIMVIKKVE